jgi:catechol 2,3-dioxygenase-like lactoylglutathione lyase family enzyme
MSTAQDSSEPVRVVGLDHVQVAIPPGGEEEARAFYGAVLGMREVPKPAPLAARGGLWLDCPGAMLHLGVEAGFRPARKAHPAFLVADLGACRAALEEVGSAIHPAEDLPGIVRLHTEDPFGNRIELMQRLPETC